MFLDGRLCVCRNGPPIAASGTEPIEEDQEPHSSPAAQHTQQQPQHTNKRRLQTKVHCATHVFTVCWSLPKFLPRIAICGSHDAVSEQQRLKHEGLHSIIIYFLMSLGLSEGQQIEVVVRSMFNMAYQGANGQRAPVFLVFAAEIAPSVWSQTSAILKTNLSLGTFTCRKPYTPPRAPSFPRPSPTLPSPRPNPRPPRPSM